jgi:hypothetical protein
VDLLDELAQGRQSSGGINAKYREAPRAPNWTEEELLVLLEHPTASDEQLAQMLPGRTVGALGTVRSFLHSYHRGGNVSGLSQMMLRVLERLRGTVVCPICRTMF